MKKYDGLEILEAVRAAAKLLELDYLDEGRFSKYGTTYPDQVVVRCSQCHTQRHANEVAASRLKRTNY